MAGAAGCMEYIDRKKPREEITGVRAMLYEQRMDGGREKVVLYN